MSPFQPLMRVFLMAGMLFLLGACNSIEEKSVLFMEDLARVLDAHKSDCEEMGQAASHFMTVRQDLLSEMRKFDKLTQDEIQKRFGTRLATAKKRILDRLIECANNIKLVDLIDQQI